METSIIGYRKVVVCIFGMILISILAVSQVPDALEASKFIAGIVALYCGINVYKGSLADNNSTTKALTETIRTQSLAIADKDLSK